MPRKATHPNFMRATIWTPTVKIESSGSPAAVIESAFHALARRPKARAALLKNLEVLDGEFKDFEARNPNDTHEVK